tara:strand:- start:4298 stop:6706 length:2409 start_codon:yes stop_codon:yes gene_type:complete
MQQRDHDLRPLYLMPPRPFAGAGKQWIPLLVTAWMLLLPTQNANADIDAAIVQRSIDRGITYLRKTQNERGSWDEYSGQSCGASALCTLALLNAGVPHDDPTMVRAMRYLRSVVPHKTYSVALQTLVFCQLGAAGDIQAIRRNVATLVKNQKQAGNQDRIGSWGYGGRAAGAGDPSLGDPSNSQFALLALGAAKDRGVEIDPAVFQSAFDYWVRHQGRGGGWAYTNQQTPSGSMTCAGIASVLITKSNMQSSDLNDRADIACCGGDDDADDPVTGGLDWLNKSFSTQVNPGGQKFTYFYYMYALERVGRLTGRRFIGGHDWYREGAERLVAIQDQFEGFWSGVNWEEDRNISTSFALLFLSKGKRQVVVAQLSRNQSEARHPDALRQLVRHVERDWRRDLTWQTIELTRAGVPDLLQAPVIVIAGREALNISEGEADRFKQYIDQGGTILFEAEGGDGCGNASAFEQSVAGLCANWFPGSKLEQLPPSHPVWFAEHRIDPESVERIGKDFWIYGIQACCRTAVFYVPQTLSCRWELSGELFRRSDQVSPAREQVESAVRLGQNVIAYATGRELKDKLDQRTLLTGGDLPETQRGVTQIAMLALDAGGLEAQRALSNVASMIRQSRPMNIAAAPEAVGFDATELQFLPVLWIHGRTDFKLDTAQQEQLREFIENKGIVFATSICGSEAFTDAFRRELSAILPGSNLQQLPAGHPALTPAFGGYDITSLQIRKPTETADGVVLSRHLGAPPLQVASVDGFDSVFFSPLDVSCALESQNSVQCHGYETTEAAKIVTNVLLYALQQ